MLALFLLLFSIIVLPFFINDLINFLGGRK